MTFPPFPNNAQEIYDFPGKGEYIACAIVHRTDIRQLMAFRRLRLRLGELTFRETLVEAMDILAHSTGIRNPGGWLFWFLREEADHVE